MSFKVNKVGRLPRGVGVNTIRKGMVEFPHIWEIVVIKKAIDKRFPDPIPVDRVC
jgi:hypothetical protein